MKKFNLYWGGRIISAGSPHNEDYVLDGLFGDAISEEVAESLSVLEIGGEVRDDDGDLWRRVE